MQFSAVLHANYSFLMKNLSPSHLMHQIKIASTAQDKSNPNMDKDVQM